MAGDRVRVRVDGLQQLGKALEQMANAVASRLAGRATGAGAKVIKTEAKLNVQRSPSIRTHSLEGAVITKKVPKSEAEFTAEHIVTVRGRGKPYTKSGNKVDRAPHAHLVEFGTVNMPAEPYLRPAYDTKKSQAAEAIATNLRAGIEREAQKLPKGPSK